MQALQPAASTSLLQGVSGLLSPVLCGTLQLLAHKLDLKGRLASCATAFDASVLAGCFPQERPALRHASRVAGILAVP